MTSNSADEQVWQDAYAARQSYFERTVGPLPGDIQRMLSMTGVWPGGGLFVIPAAKLGQHMSVYTTFGLTNPDMPTSVRMSEFQLESSSHARQARGKLQKREPAHAPPGAAGYGYEIFVVAQQEQKWPLMFLQWAVTAEIEHDVGFLARIEKHDGLTVEEIDVGYELRINVLIAKVRPPLPIGTRLPNGAMELLVATTITQEEMRWSMTGGRGVLLQRLQDAGVGQISIPGRPSVVQ